MRAFTIKAIVGKRQHTVPRFYLEGFATDRVGGRGTSVFWVYDKQGGEPTPQTPVNTTVEAHYYTIDPERATSDSEGLEKLLARYESDTQPVVKRFLESEEVDEEGLGALLPFLGQLITRGPRAVKAMREQHNALLAAHLKVTSREELAWHIAQSRSDLTVAEAEERFRDPLSWAELGFEGKQALYDSLMQTDAYVNAMTQMGWSLLKAPSATRFVTGDTPCCVFVPVGPGAVLLQYGIGVRTAEVSLPLSPTIMLFGSYHSHRTTLTAKHVRELNKRTARVADRWVISSIRSAALGRMIRKLGPESSEPRIDPAAVERTVRDKLRQSRRRGD